MSNEDGGHDRPAGVRFGPLKRALREHSYPVSAAELVEQYGGFELETATGAERLEKTLEGCERTKFHEPREVRDAILDALGEETGSEGGTSAEAGEAETENGWSRLST